MHIRSRGKRRLLLVAATLGTWVLIAAFVVGLLLIVQLFMMRRFLRAPVAPALWYSGFGVPLFVLGMMASAFAAA